MRYSSTKPKETPGKFPIVDTFYDKVEFCRGLLHIHGFITETENTKVKQRIHNWVNEHFMEKKK